jgi:hypothetical protein
MSMMRKYINIINEAFNGFMPGEQNKAGIFGDSERHEELKKHKKKIIRFQKEMEDNLHAEITAPIAIQRCPKFGTKEWDEHIMWVDYELSLGRKKEAREQEVRRIKAQQEHDAKIQGIRFAAKDAMHDAIEQDRELVSKLAKQAITKAEKSKQRVAKIANRQLKK